MTTSAARPRSYEFILLALLVLLWGSVGLNRIGLGLIFPQIKAEFGMPNWQASLLIAGTSITWAFASWAGGWLSDRYGRRRVLLPAVAFICVMTAAMGGAWSFLSMFLVRDLLGIGDGVGWSVGQATISEEVAPQRRGVSQALFTAGYTLIGAGAGALIITSLSVHFGWRWAFPLIAAATTPVVIALALIMREPVMHQAHAGAADWRAATRLLRKPSLVLLTIMGCAILSWLQVFAGFDHSFLVESRHFSPIDAGEIASCWGFVGAVGSVLLPLASDYWGRRPVVLASALVCAASLAAYLFGGFDKTTMQLLLGLSGFCGFGLLPIVLATCVSESVGEEERGAALGVTNFFGVIIGTTLMPFVGGVLADGFGLTATLCIPIAAQLAVAGCVLAVTETAPRAVARRGMAQARQAA
ncbi:MAG TPA: MFS transporter [Stellaceae bacterium]|nr:MFS transporter [Stellaceae bacterium]